MKIIFGICRLAEKKPVDSTRLTEKYLRPLRDQLRNTYDLCKTQGKISRAYARQIKKISAACARKVENAGDFSKTQRKIPEASAEQIEKYLRTLQDR